MPNLGIEVIVDENVNQVILQSPGPQGVTGPTGLIGETGPTGPVFQNVDGGTATTIYGGSSIIDCGNAAGV